ncbi:melanoma antigen preferentially expressed in tumors-like [Meriones unguiculatus]|uniref:melanoma antigen preferentially expressed in tumors-like n=1 Tax=Meriones unguiculatus TaxID=10047 RepID=UPI00293F2256|nr:melanoma antigen preferentially expressed in tumors-like [Meriones unguiculatus]
MDAAVPNKLLDLAVQSLLSNESAAIQALEDIPRELFVPLFIAAFKGGHKSILSAMVKVWPFYCLHIGSLSIEETHHELLKAMIENLPVCPAQNSSPRRPKLRILDLRQITYSRITCPEITTKSPFCFHSCSYSDRSITKIEGHLRLGNSGIETQSLRPVELLVDLFLDGSLVQKEFLDLLMSKAEESSGSLHVCCRDLRVDKLHNYKCSLKFFDLKCVDQFSVDKGLLSDINSILSRMAHLQSLSLFKVSFRSLSGNVFKNFLSHLHRMENLKELNLVSFYLKNHLDKVMRFIPPGLDFLYLPFCNLSSRDYQFLSQSPQATHLKLLNLSNNTMQWNDLEHICTLLVNLSGTLQILELNNCFISDSSISVLIPALIRCTHLRVLGFASNPITMPILVNIMNNLTPLMELKYVIYPIPVHCFDDWHFQGSVDRRKLAIVQLQLKTMLELAQRNDMNWITYTE